MKQHKKFLVWICNILAFVFIFSLVGCDRNGAADCKCNSLELEIKALQNLCEQLQNELSENEKSVAALKDELALLTAKVDNLAGKEPDFTEIAPLYTKNENYIEHIRFDHHEDSSVSFNGFVEYCQKELSDYHLYLLAPITDAYDFHPNRHRTYSVFLEETEGDIATNVIFYERLMMYSQILGSEFDASTKDGYVPWSIDLQIFLVPFEEQLPLSDIDLRFGKTDNDYWCNYINIYILDKCIATCFYRENAQISKKWFENYFKNFLIFI